MTLMLYTAHQNFCDDTCGLVWFVSLRLVSQVTSAALSLGTVSVFMFLKEVSYAYQSCLHLIKTTVKTEILWNIFLQFKITFLYIKNNIFLVMTTLLQSSVSHDPSEIILICWFGAQYFFFLLLSMLKTAVLLNIFGDSVIHFFRIL